MTQSPLCPQCKKPLAIDAPQGLCPECLLAAALASQVASQSGSDSAHTAEVTGLYSSPTPTAAPTDAGLRLKYFGDYELLNEIARGGMGVVWKARQVNLNRDVALKMIRAGALASPDEVARFLREAEAAANLPHPNIVAIHEVGEHDGQHYFSMDLVDGRDLASLVSEGPLAPQRAARYVKIIAEAIHFAHQRGTLHRDLKPQNVLIDTADQPRITDFGLAKIMKDDSQLTQSGVVMGSPSYMPPEQAASRHGEIGPASDVYSLGAMLYELLTGRPPFRGATAMATLGEVLGSEPTSLRQLKADIPPDLETICLKCLEKSPAVRYPTARALAEELERFLKGEPILARPAGAVRKIVNWVRRHPGVLVTLTALIVVALVFSVFFLYEDNAFLRAHLVDPSLVRNSGPLHESLQVWSMVSGCITFSIGIWTFIVVNARSRGASFKDALDPMLHSRPLQPLGERTRALAVVTGLGLIGCGLILLLATIRAHVWEGESIWGQVGLVYVSIVVGLALLAVIIRDHRLVYYGTPSRQLTPEQIESIRSALEENCQMAAAVGCYIKAVPDAGIAEAHQYVMSLFNLLRAKDPDKYVLPTLSLANLNWKKMLKVAVIGAALLGGWWFIMPPGHPVSAIVQFVGGFLFATGIMASVRVKGLWKRMLMLIPGVAVLTFGEALASWLVEPTSHSPLAFVAGVLFGILLMTAGFKSSPSLNHVKT